MGWSRGSPVARLAVLAVALLVAACGGLGATPSDDEIRSNLAVNGLDGAAIVARIDVGDGWTTVLLSTADANAAMLFDPDDHLRSTGVARSDHAEAFSSGFLLGGPNPLGDPVPRVAAGIVTDERIVRLAVRIGERWETWDVGAPGYAVVLPADGQDREVTEWILEDAAGNPVVMAVEETAA